MPDLLLSREGHGVVRVTSSHPHVSTQIVRIARPYWKQTPDEAGVYLLIGDREGRPAIYVGMSKSTMRGRIASHHVSEQKEWFGVLYAIPLDINYVQPIEAELIRAFTEAEYAEVMNKAPEARWAGVSDSGVRALFDDIIDWLEILVGSDIVYGPDEATAVAPPEGVKRKWTEEEWLSWLDQDGPPGLRAAAEACLASWRASGHRLAFGAGRKAAAVFPVRDIGGNSYWAFAVYATNVVLHLAALSRRPVSDDEELRREFLRRLNAVDGIDIDLERNAAQPSFPTSALIDPTSRQMILDAEAWLMEQIEAGNASS